MSLKNDIEMVKEELNSEEKFFEKAVITEKFIKKYKNVMIGSVALIVIAVAGNIIYDIKESSRLNSTNSALLSLQKDSSDTKALEELKSLSPTLFDVWSYSQAISNKDIDALKKLANSKTLIINDLVAYELAQDSKDITKLDAYSSKQDAIYSDLAQIQSAIILIKEDKVELAHQKLATIDKTSSLYSIAKSLRHYGVK